MARTKKLAAGEVCDRCGSPHEPTRNLNGHQVRRCQGHSKRTHKQCMGSAQPEFNVCRMHGGNALVGIANPNYQGKGTSRRTLPIPLVDAYQKAMADPDLIAARDTLSIVEARIDQLLGQLQATPDDGLIWANLRRWIDQGRKLRDTERKRLEAMQAYLTSEQAHAMVGTIVEIMKRNVSDHGVLKRILVEVQQLVAISAPSRMLPDTITTNAEPT